MFRRRRETGPHRNGVSPSPHSTPPPRACDVSSNPTLTGRTSVTDSPKRRPQGTNRDSNEKFINASSVRPWLYLSQFLCYCYSYFGPVSQDFQGWSCQGRLTVAWRRAVKFLGRAAPSFAADADAQDALLALKEAPTGQ